MACAVRSALLSLLSCCLLAAAGSERDCASTAGPVVHGATVSAPRCQRQTCEDGVLRVDACPPVPVGCTAVSQDETKPHPACCTQWCCGDDCADAGAAIDRSGGGGGDRTGNRISGCFDGNKVIAHGDSSPGWNCTKLSCVDGYLKTEVCPRMPARGCRYTSKEDRSKGYPHCCPTFCCGARCPPAPGTRGSPDCVFQGNVLPNGYWRSTSGCRRTTCNNGRLQEQSCQPPRDSSCYLTFWDQRQEYPLCCPHYCCGITCALTARVPDYPPLRRGECLFQDHIVLPHRGRYLTPKCEEVTCQNGVLLPSRRCRTLPPGCPRIPGDASRPYPACCDRWPRGCENRRRFRALDAEAEALSVCSADNSEDGSCVTPEEVEGGEDVEGEVVEGAEPVEEEELVEGEEMVEGDQPLEDASEEKRDDFSDDDVREDISEDLTPDDVSVVNDA